MTATTPQTPAKPSAKLTCLQVAREQPGEPTSLVQGKGGRS